MIAPQSGTDVCTVITTFRPDEGFPERVERVRSQVGLVVIVDDGESSENVIRLGSWFSEVPNIILHHNPCNVGVAASLNTGVAIANQKHFEWILTLDDDSAIKQNMVDRLIHYLRQIKGSKPVGLIGMSWSHPGESTGVGALDSEPLWLEKWGIITSGSLFSLQAYCDIGPFRNDFVIDAVDYDYCLRARTKGYRVIKVGEIGFEHSLGRRTTHSLLRKRFEVFNHTPLRLYYNYRNLTVLALENLSIYPLYSCAALKQQFHTLFIVICFEEDKKRKLYSILKGIAHGLGRRLGKNCCPVTDA